MSVTCCCWLRPRAAVDAQDRQADVVQPVDRDEEDDEEHGQERDHARVAALLDDLGGALLGQPDRVRLIAGGETLVDAIEWRRTCARAA